MQRMRHDVRERNIYRWAAHLLSDLTEIRVKFLRNAGRRMHERRGNAIRIRHGFLSHADRNQSAARLAGFLRPEVQRRLHFHHTFQTLRITFSDEGFSNDFAQWALADANRNDLAESSPRSTFAITFHCRAADLYRLTSDYCAAFPHFRQATLERFISAEHGGHSASRPQRANAGRIPKWRAHLSHASFTFTSSLRGPSAAADERFFALACRRPGTRNSSEQRRSHRHLHQYMDSSRQTAAADRPRKQGEMSETLALVHSLMTGPAGAQELKSCARWPFRGRSIG
jgi:hypothetical protein